MSKPSVAIFGASGLVGSALCDRMYFQHGACFRALIHTVGNAARIARYPIEIQKVNLLAYDQVRRAVTDCECVVNCVLGDRPAMIEGLQNIIRAASECGVKKFIHLGSIAIYGENPAPNCESEDATPAPSNEYGHIKLSQDKLIFESHRRGMNSIILCPGFITGPYSTFVSDAMEKLSAEGFVLVDAGRHPTNHIHVDNLVEAILTAMHAKEGWGERYFVTEAERPTWAQFYSDLRDILGLRYEFGEVAREDVVSQLRKEPHEGLFSGGRRFTASVVHRLSTGLSRKLQLPTKARGQGSTGPGRSSFPDLSQRFIAVQARRPHFAPHKIRERLGYKPILTYSEGMDTIRTWYHFPSSLGQRGSANPSSKESVIG